MDREDTKRRRRRCRFAVAAPCNFAPSALAETPTFTVRILKFLALSARTFGEHGLYWLWRLVLADELEIGFTDGLGHFRNHFHFGDALDLDFGCFNVGFGSYLDLIDGVNDIGRCRGLSKYELLRASANGWLWLDVVLRGSANETICTEQSDSEGANEEENNYRKKKDCDSYGTYSILQSRQTQKILTR